MPTTFAPAYKNKLIDSLTGRASTTNVLRYIRPYDGAQPADPTATPVGVSAYTAVTSAIDVNGIMSNAGVGVTQLAAPKAASANTTTGTLTFARIYDAAQVAMVDCTVGLSGSVGVILDLAAASSGANLTATGFTYKIPQSLGTVFLNTDLVNALAQAMFVTAANVALCTSTTMIMYSGTAPASADAPLSGNTALVTFTFGATSPWTTAVAGSATMTPNLQAVASATGTGTFVRIVKGSLVLQGTAGTTATDFLFDTVAITSGNTITFNEATISL